MDIIEDQGIFAFVKVAGLQRIAIDGHSLYHQFGDGKSPLSTDSLLRAIHSCNFKTKLVKVLANNINISALPAIGVSRYGYFVIAGVNKDKEYLIIDPQTRAIKKLSFQGFEALFDNQIIYLTPSQRTQSRKYFDIKWFIPALWKYKHIFRDVLIASFLLQLFALITPLFFQVVMDKVIVHQALTTLEILAIGFVIVSVFEVVLGAIRSYLLVHTTSRVDVELGSRLYKLDSAVFFKKFTCNFSQALFKHIFYSNSLPHQIDSYQSQLNAFLMGVNRIISTIAQPFFHKHF